MSSPNDNDCSYRSRVDEIIDAFSISDGCTSCLLAIIVPIVAVLLFWGLWILFTTPSPEPAPPYDPRIMQGVPGFGTDRPTSLPTESSLPW